ncbi:hypothetical protein KVP10_08285 [Candidimonas humi]|uniref:Uncharacterized protein n=1 Tax=Candidimonas humi TaxID=683355 RepID=A0ABV8NXZ7_9BURK|nr:hypothetical protein [Candidimonas humi]MBV6304883.1 hypothetical protein [Candidimonas humi]
MSDFGTMPAFPEPVLYDPTHQIIESGRAYGFCPGLNIQQHVWLTLYAARIASGETHIDALLSTDKRLDAVLKRLEELA